MKKILFLPNYLYASMPDFESVAALQELKDVEKKVLLFNDKHHATGSMKNDTKIKRMDITVVKKTGCLRMFKGKGVISRSFNAALRSLNLIIALVNLPVDLANYIRVALAVRSYGPDMLIISSDLGNTEQRFVIGACEAIGAKVLMLYSFDISPSGVSRYAKLLTRLLSSKDHVTGFLKSVSVPFGRVPGTYCVSCKIAVVSESIKNRLVEKGIASDRVQVVSISKKDRVTRGSQRKRVAFFTEVLDEVYGKEKVESMLEEIAEQLSLLSHEDPRIEVVARLHPRESGDWRQRIRTIFLKNGISVFEDGTAEELIASSDLNLAFFSKVLMTSAMIGRPFLSFNLMNERKRTFIPEAEMSVLEINDKEAIAHRVKAALYDDSYLEKITESAKKVFPEVFSGKGATRLAELISAVMNGGAVNAVNI